MTSAGLPNRVQLDPALRALAGDAESFRPRHLPFMDQADSDTRNILARHHFGDALALGIDERVHITMHIAWPFLLGLR